MVYIDKDHDDWHDPDFAIYNGLTLPLSTSSRNDCVEYTDVCRRGNHRTDCIFHAGGKSPMATTLTR